MKRGVLDLSDSGFVSLERSFGHGNRLLDSVLNAENFSTT